VEVSFDIDANGILNVKAKDKATSKEQSIRIEATSGLSKEEIEKMKQDAESHAEEDKKKKEGIDTKNMADTLVYSTEKALKDAGDKVPEADKKTIEEKLEALKKVKDSDNMDEIKKATEELSAAAQKIGQAMYSDQKTGDSGQKTEAQAQPNAQAQTEGKKSDDAEEGEIVDEKDKK